MSIIRVQMILLSRLNTMLEPFGLTLARYEALMLLYFSRRGTLPLGKMGTRLQVHPTSVTNLVDSLERAGLACRQPHASDRRMTLATITDAGREVGEAATKILNNSHFGMDPLPPQALDTIIRTLAIMRERAGDFVSPDAESQGSAK
jgi:DNA-binding MarR family transcriptional regulator